MVLMCLALWHGPSESADPLALLKSLEGNWRLSFYQIDESETYQLVGTSESQVEIKLDGKLIQEETTILTAASRFPLVVLYSYDSVRQVYRKASTDAVTGLMDIQEGTLQGKVLTLTNVERKTWFVGSSGKELAFRIQLDFSDENRPLMIADLSLDHGANWFKFQKVQYERLASGAQSAAK